MVDNQHWLDRWRENRIGFHESAVNRHLQAYYASFELKPGARVFMPLCGKARDIQWLANQGCQVIGIEISQLAIEAFFSEHELEYECRDTDRFTIYRRSDVSAGAITLLLGDFYDLRADDLVDCRLVYDRAALIAIEAHDRPRYYQQMLTIMPQACQMLLVTFSYDQTEMRGPPFAVANEEVCQFYQESFSIELLETSDIIDERPRWRQVGLSALSESVFRFAAKRA